MCGILGIVDHKGVDEGALKHMRDTMFHRGPDAAGVWISNNGRVGLAHRRLSIIDLSKSGRQPMSDSNGDVWISYNGEIYNFQEIRDELSEKGYRFRSSSDTEVIIYAYMEWGRNCLKRLNGMFAFGIYDDREKIMFLARDRIGKKPLYYLHDKTSGKFLFASEIKALLKDSSISRDMDIQALNSYFTFGYIPGELCIFKGIKKLLPAHAMTYSIQSGQIDTWCYWDVPQLAEHLPSKERMLEELEKLLEDAVRLRMISDVPLGAFLSGGVDSSLVVAMMSRISDRPVKTFSIGFEDNAFNELPYARVVADHFGTEHHEIIVKPDAFNILPEIVRQFDEPFADSSMIPTYYVSKATREHVTVALSGDGGDELFGGYKIYMASLFDYYTRMLTPLFLRKGLSTCAEYLPDRGVGKLKKQLLILKFDINDVYIERYIHLYFNQSKRAQLFSDEISALLKDEFLSPELSRLDYLKKGRGDFVNNLTYTDMKTYLPDDIMVKVDRASMMVSLETRAPILDYRIAEFAFRNVPGNFKVRMLKTKYLLKKLSEKLLPAELDINRKWGFVIPVSDWFRGPLASHVREILLDDKSTTLFNKGYIEMLLKEHADGSDHSGRLFTLLVFNLWKSEYLGND